MSGSLFERCLGSESMAQVFADASLVGQMLRFEAALARAQAEEGVIPAASATAIAAACNPAGFDIDALMVAARRAGSFAIPVVKALTAKVAAVDPDAAGFVHWGSTSQDVLDTAMVLATREGLRLVDADLRRLVHALLRLADAHASTPVLARTLLQPAQVVSLGFKAVNWAAPVLRSTAALRDLEPHACQLQLGGATGTLSVMGASGAAVARRVGALLDLSVPPSAWHTQRDSWMRLACEMGILAGGLGKLATDLALMSQAEVGELAEPSGEGRGGSSAMPHKRNPVAAMTALSACARVPQQVAALMAAMPQAHERGIGNWQAELALWPSIFVATHGALAALADAFEALQVFPDAMRRNIDALNGLVFAESAASVLARSIGRPRAHALMEQLSRSASAAQPLAALVDAAVVGDDALAKAIDRAELAACFDSRRAAEPARRIAAERALQLAAELKGLPPLRPAAR